MLEQEIRPTESSTIFSQSLIVKENRGPNIIQRINRKVYDALVYCPPDPLNNFETKTPFGLIFFLLPIVGQVLLMMYVLACLTLFIRSGEVRYFIFGNDE